MTKASIAASLDVAIANNRNLIYHQIAPQVFKSYSPLSVKENNVDLPDFFALKRPSLTS